MANAKKCDRCGEFYVNDEKTYDGRSYNPSGTHFFNRLVLEKGNSITGSYVFVNYFDLCPDCRLALRMFLTEKQPIED